MKTDRLLRIVYILLGRPSITAPELARLTEVSVRTIYRDIEALNLAGLPVCATAGRGGGIALLPGFTLDKTLLTAPEQSLLLQAVRAYQVGDDACQRLAQKLQAMFHGPSADWLQIDLSRWGQQTPQHDQFDACKQAILARHPLQITYWGANGVMSRRDICPLKIIYKQSAWYVQAYCLKARGFRTFKLSRMTSWQALDTPFPPEAATPPPIDAAQGAPVKMVELTLRAPAHLAHRIYDEFPPQDIRSQQDGVLQVRTMAPEGGWLCGYLLTYGDALEVVAPAFLREQVQAVAARIAKKYAAR